MNNTVHANKSPGNAAKPTEPKLKVSIGGTAKRYTPAQLRGPDGEALLKEIRSAPSPVVIRLTNLMKFSDADRWVVLDVAAGATGAQFETGDGTCADLLTAVLAVFPAGLDLVGTRTARLAALEAAVLTFADALDLACQGIKERMQQLGYKGVRTADLKKEAVGIREKVLQAARNADAAHATHVRSVLPDAPVSADAVVPARWHFSAAGVRPSADQSGEGLAMPIVVTGVSRDVQHGGELVSVAWLREGLWPTATVERKVLANKNAVLDLAAKGFAVHSGNAAALVRFLHDYLVANQAQLTATNVCSQLGWQGKRGTEVFLWGRTLIGGAAPQEPATPTPSPASTPFQFRGADEGDDQIASGFHQAGTLDAWLSGIKRIGEYPRVRLGLYTAFVPPMLHVLESENFVLDFSGATSQGKTTTLRVGASVWGKPGRDGHEGTALYDWNTTQTWRERAPAIMNNIPLFLDDTKTVRNPDEIAQTVYTFTQGRSRGRGTISGLAQQVGFQSVLISSGERPVVSFGEHGGTRPRVLTLWGSPFGGTSEKTARRVTTINRVLSENYGHAGPRFVEHLVQNQENWATCRERHAFWTQVYAEKAKGNAVAGRMAAHFAAIVFTSRVVHHVLDMPWLWEDPIAPLYEELTKEAAEADRAAAALRHAMSWAVANRNNFFHLNHSESEQPSCGWAGRWDRDGDIKQPELSSKWEYIGFIPKTLAKILDEGGFEVDPAIRTWKDRGWLKVSEGRTQYRVKLGRESTWVVAVAREGVEKAGAA